MPDQTGGLNEVYKKFMIARNIIIIILSSVRSGGYSNWEAIM